LIDLEVSYGYMLKSNHQEEYSKRGNALGDLSAMKVLAEKV